MLSFLSTAQNRNKYLHIIYSFWWGRFFSNFVYFSGSPTNIKNIHFTEYLLVSLMLKGYKKLLQMYDISIMKTSKKNTNTIFPHIALSIKQFSSSFNPCLVFAPKGQIISEVNFGVLNFPKNQQNYLKDFCPNL